MSQKQNSKATRMSIDSPIKDFVIKCAQKKKPNAKTRKAMNDARKGKTQKAKDFSDLWSGSGAK